MAGEIAAETYERHIELVKARAAKKAFIAAPTGGVTVDAEARTAINAIRQLLIDLQLMNAS